MSFKTKSSHSSPADDRVCATSQELKELFKDPAVRKKNADNATKKKKENYCSSRRDSSSDSNDAEAAVSIVKVVEPNNNLAEKSLITRRITIAGGFLDIALFTANCEQLKFVLELGSLHIYYEHVLALLILSLVLQLLVGCTMFLLGCQVITRINDETYTNVLNYATMGLVALITIVNIFIGTFGPKGTAVARCLAAFAFPNRSGPVRIGYLNATWYYMRSGEA